LPILKPAAETTSLPIKESAAKLGRCRFLYRQRRLHRCRSRICSGNCVAADFCIGSGNWVAADFCINSGNWVAADFCIDSEDCIAADPESAAETEFRCATHKSAANINSLQEVQLRQRNRISLRNTQIGGEYQIAAGGSVAEAKQNFSAQYTIRQRISIRCSRFSCGSKTEFRCATHKSAANMNSLQEVQLRQRNRISLRNTQISSEY
jgi:hypothetical protein